MLSDGQILILACPFEACCNLSNSINVEFQPCLIGIDVLNSKDSSKISS